MPKTIKKHINSMNHIFKYRIHLVYDTYLGENTAAHDYKLDGDNITNGKRQLTCQ